MTYLCRTCVHELQKLAESSSSGGTSRKRGWDGDGEGNSQGRSVRRR